MDFAFDSGAALAFDSGAAAPVRVTSCGDCLGIACSMAPGERMEHLECMELFDAQPCERLELSRVPGLDPGERSDACAAGHKAMDSRFAMDTCSAVDTGFELELEQQRFRFAWRVCMAQRRVPRSLPLWTTSLAASF